MWPIESLFNFSAEVFPCGLPGFHSPCTYSLGHVYWRQILKQHIRKELYILYMLVTQSMVIGDEMALSRFRPSLHFPLVVIWTQSHGRSKELGKGHYMRDLALCKGGVRLPMSSPGFNQICAVWEMNPSGNETTSHVLFIDDLNIKYCESILLFEFRCLNLNIWFQTKSYPTLSQLNSFRNINLEFIRASSKHGCHDQPHLGPSSSAHSSSSST